MRVPVAVASVAVLLSLSNVGVAGTTIRGEVSREPARNSNPVTFNRYGERGGSRPERVETSTSSETCGCNPGDFAVVHLSGDVLPTPKLPMQPPVMAQKDRSFVPAVLAIPVGATVEFPNLDPFFHNVFSYSKPRKFDLGRYPKGESERVVFDKPGIVPIFCEIHYSMRAYVHVLDSPYYAVSDEKRRFQIPDVDPGEYVLHVWQENLPEITVPITVGDEPLHIVVP